MARVAYTLLLAHHFWAVLVPAHCASTSKHVTDNEHRLGILLTHSSHCPLNPLLGWVALLTPLTYCTAPGLPWFCWSARTTFLFSAAWRHGMGSRISIPHYYCTRVGAFCCAQTDHATGRFCGQRGAAGFRFMYAYVLAEVYVGRGSAAAACA